jgi:hypothetical protein
MKLSTLALIFVLAGTGSCHAQDITVHVVDDDTQKPIKGITLNLRTDCLSPKRPKALQQKTDAFGTAVFHSVSLAGEPICIDTFSVIYGYAAHKSIDYVFASREKVEQLKLGKWNSVVTALPAEVTYYLQKRSLGERLQFLFQGP